MNDLISRQAAIDAIKAIPDLSVYAYCSFVDAIMKLPSAQHDEPIHIKHSSGLYECFLYECFHCGARAVVWDCDYDAEDYGYDCPGVVHACHCENCGAEIEYAILDYGEEQGNETN